MTDRSDPFRGRSFAYRTFARRRPCPRATYCSFTPAHGEHPRCPRAVRAGVCFAIARTPKRDACRLRRKPRPPHAVPRRARPSGTGRRRTTSRPPILHRFICAGARHKLYAPHLRSCRAPHERRNKRTFSIRRGASSRMFRTLLPSLRTPQKPPHRLQSLFPTASASAPKICPIRLFFSAAAAAEFFWRKMKKM